MIIPKAHIEFISNKKARLLKDLTVKFDGCKFTIKKGYITDGASIPALFWSLGLHPFQGDTLTASIFHDIFYNTESYSYFSANNNFRYLMRKNGVGFIKRNLFWLAVTLFGKMAYFSHTVGSVTLARQYLQIKKAML